MNEILHQDEITWVLERIPLVERADVLMLNDAELLAYASLLQREVRALRALAQAGIQTTHQLTRELARERQRTAQLRDELRELKSRFVGNRAA